MGFIRLLLLLAGGYLLYRFILKLLAPPTPRHSQKPATPDNQVGHLVRCDQCNTLIPPEAALRVDNHTFCSEPCRAKGQNTD